MPDPTFTRPPPLTVHQVVAHNFRLARLAAGWTQQQTSDRLEPYVGFAPRQAGISAIERTGDPSIARTRNLDVAEVAAFAACFGRSIAWFFTPAPSMCSLPLAGLGVDVNGAPVPAATLTELITDEDCEHGQLDAAISHVVQAVDQLRTLADPHAVEASA